MRKNKIFAKTAEELQLDFSKLPVTKSVFPLVGNLFNEAIDSFEFTDRGSNGAIPMLMRSALETCEPDSLMKINIPRLTGFCHCALGIPNVNGIFVQMT